MLPRIMKTSGLASIIGGLSLGIYQLMHPARDAHSVLNSPYALIHSLGIVSVILLLFGIVGIYIRMSEHLGRRGGISFIIVFLGTALEVGALSLDAFLNPAMATYAPAVQTAGHGSGIFHQLLPLYGGAIFILPLGWILFILGQLWFGTLILRTRQINSTRFAGLLIIFGSPLFGAQLFVPVWIETIGGILLGLGYAWLGLFVLNNHQSNSIELSPKTN